MAVLPVAIGAGLAAGGVAGAMFGKKKIKRPDITAQLAQVKQSTGVGRRRVDDLYSTLQPLTEKYQTGSEQAIEGSRERAGGERTQYLGESQKIADEAKNALRANLYSESFGGLPDTLRAVREASAAGAGIDSGAYQQSVQNIGKDLSRTLVEGERDIQVEGLRGMQNAQTTAYQTFNALSSKLDDQQLDVLTRVMDTGREDLVRRTSQQLGLDESETQAILDLLNFQQSGQLAASSADAANQQALYNALISGGTTLAGAGLGK